MNKKKVILLMIVFITIIIFFIIVALLNLNNNKISDLNSNIIQNDEEINEKIVSDDEIKLNNILMYVQDRTEYFSIKNIYKKYVSYSESGMNKELLSQFSENYIKSKGINENNVKKIVNIDTIENPGLYGSYTCIINKMITSEINENQKIYLIYGKYILKSTSKIQDLNLMIIVNNNDNVYCIYPYEYMKEKGYDKYNIGQKVTLENIQITRNDYNQKEIVTKTDSELSSELMDDFNILLISDKREAYDKLNAQYKKQKFSDYTKFEEFLSNKKYIPTINQYRVYSKDDYTDYICTDQYNNYYIFRVQGGVMRYTVFLDNYTVELESFKENYDKSNDSGKIAIQTGKFKQMLNLKDYNAIYSKLNEKFKDNNFKTVSDLKKYLDEKIYNINSIEIQEIAQKDDYYVCNGVIKNQQNQNEQKNIVIAIKLISSNEFELSFSIE